MSVRTPLQLGARGSVPRNTVAEIELTAANHHDDAWSTLAVSVEFTDPDGRVRTVPAFWDGSRTWRVRYSSATEGAHRYRTAVDVGTDPGLDGHRGELLVSGYNGTNMLLQHGAPVVAADRRHLAHADGTPFLWLADTWWSAMTARFRWPDVFQTIADDRARKGFNVVQLVAGLLPEFEPFSPPMASEGGQPWLEAGQGSINPEYYAVPDRKIDYIVEKGMVPCIVGGWGYFANVLGPERLALHWRYLVARYGAYPVVWCIGGEVDLRVDHGVALGDLAIPADQVRVWEDMSALVAEIDPFDRIRTAHPCPIFNYSTSEAFASRDSFELDMLQTGHTGIDSIGPTMEHLRQAMHFGDKPVLNGECNYEGIFGSSWDDIQRFLFWSHMLSGTAGHTYGTMPLSTFNSRTDPHVPLSGVSMHFWEDAIDWAGATHVGVGKAILERLEWWRLQPSPGAIDPHSGPDKWFLPYAARIGEEMIVVYMPGLGMPGGYGRTLVGAWTRFASLTLRGLTAGATYTMTYANPRDGVTHETQPFIAEASEHALSAGGPWVTPTGEDWVLIVRRAD